VGRQRNVKAVHVDLDATRQAFFAKSPVCLCASPLGKRYGWACTTTRYTL